MISPRVDGRTDRRRVGRLTAGIGCWYAHSVDHQTREHWVETVPSRDPPDLLAATPSYLTPEGRIAQYGVGARGAKRALHDPRRWVRWTARALLGLVVGVPICLTVVVGLVALADAVF